MLRNILVSLFLLLLVSTGAWAQDLYSGVVPVPDQSEEERRRAVPDALIHVLQKQSGQRDIPLGPALESALGRANELLLSFQYREVMRTLPDGQQQPELQLVARFLPDAVDRTVRELGLQRWRVERAPVVLWVVVDDGRGRTLMPFEYQYAFDRMEELASLRGLPVEWPGLSRELMDQVDLQLLWGGYTDQLILPGSQSEGVAIVAARREGPEWNLRWTYADTRTSTSWRTRNGDLSLALNEGVNQLTDLVASVNAIGPADLEGASTELLVTGLNGSDDYARALGYLESLSLVDEVRVLGASTLGLRFALTLNADPSYLEESLRRDGVFEASEVPAEYRLRPSGGSTP